MIVNYNGKFVPSAEPCVTATDGGFLFGDTLFETIKTRGRALLFLGDHLDRLELSARLLAFPFSREVVETALRETVELFDWPTARLRLTLSRGPFTSLDWPAPEGAFFLLQAVPYEEPETERVKGAACLLAPNRRVNPLSHLPQMKRGNYADCLYALDFVRRRGAREALFVTSEGLVQEGATSNIFLVINGALATPPAGELVLAGIMRRRVLQLAAGMGLTTEERDIHVQEVFAAEEVFLTNSLIDVLPLSSVEGRAVRRGTAAHRLLQGVEELAGNHAADKNRGQAITPLDHMK